MFVSVGCIPDTYVFNLMIFATVRWAYMDKSHLKLKDTFTVLPGTKVTKSKYIRHLISFLFLTKGTNQIIYSEQATGDRRSQHKSDSQTKLLSTIKI